MSVQRIKAGPDALSPVHAIRAYASQVSTICMHQSVQMHNRKDAQLTV